MLNCSVDLLHSNIAILRTNFSKRLDEFQRKFWFLLDTHVDRDLSEINKDIMLAVEPFTVAVNSETEKIAEVKKAVEDVKKDLKFIRHEIDAETS